MANGADRSAGVHNEGSEKTALGWLEGIAHWLPSQPPIKDFIHHNTLHAFQNRPFSLGVEEAGAFFGARSYESFEFYRGRYKQGLISESALDRAIEQNCAPQLRAEWKKKLVDGNWEEPLVPPGFSATGIRTQWRDRYGLDLDALTHPLLFRLLSNFLDQGVALWDMPDAEAGLWKAVGRLVRDSWLPLVPLSDKRLSAAWEMGEEEAIEYCLSRLVGRVEDRPRYVLEMLLRHPGWSGMVVQVELNPSSLLSRRPITLRQAVALELMIELGWVYRKLGENFTALSLSGDAVAEPVRIRELSPAQRAKKTWHEAFELSFYDEFFHALYAKIKTPSASPTSPEVQAAFCIDDREGGLRRHFEECWSEVETFGVAGFFGIDVMYQGVDDCYPAQHCPVVLRPKHLLRSKRVSMAPNKTKAFRNFHLDQGSNTLFRGWLITQVLGFSSAFRLALSVFRPAPSHATATSLSKVELDSELHLLRESDEPTPDGYLLGFTKAEMAQRVLGLLRQIGAVENFADLFVMVAHGASSTNNPHFAAYDCGACSGKPGAPNARAFAQMANDPDVRVLVAEQGVKIPSSTYFLGAMHDTTRDEIVFFDEQLVPQSLVPRLSEFKVRMERALARNARERCRRFLMVPTNISEENAHLEVKRRASAIFEPRPELNHATNCLLIVGRRKWTRGLFMDRRAFMNSYDPTRDPQGQILTAILSAAIPVCGGINLEYLFSRVDCDVYGAGTKLPHNVFGLIGVANGVEGDLRTGLPSQMIEAHDPVRLLATVEQKPAVALEAAKRNPVVWEFIENGWVFYSCLDPETRKLYMLVGDKMVEVPDVPVVIATTGDSLEWAKQGSENLPLSTISMPGGKR